MDEQKLNPFEGLKRRRLPAMHMITAEEGDVPLYEALAGHLFCMLHDRIKHTCLIEAAIEKQKAAVAFAQGKASSPDGATLASVFGIMGNLALVGEEWSYLPDEDAFPFYLQAGSMIDLVQRWLGSFREKPVSAGVWGPMVEPTRRAFERASRNDTSLYERDRAYVENLLKEIEPNNPTYVAQLREQRSYHMGIPLPGRPEFVRGDKVQRNFNVGGGRHHGPKGWWTKPMTVLQVRNAVNGRQEVLLGGGINPPLEWVWASEYHLANNDPLPDNIAEAE